MLKNIFYIREFSHHKQWKDMLRQLAQFLEDNALACFFKRTFGVDCLGCGSQRSFILLLRGELKESIEMYPALIPLLITIILTCLHVIFNIKNGHRIILLSFSITVVLMIVNFILKQFIL